MENTTLTESLQGFLTHGKDWEKFNTSIAGVFVVKVPGAKNHAARLMVEVNPVDQSGKPRKKKGIFIADFEMYCQFLEALQDDRVGKLLKTLEPLNPIVKNNDKVLEIE